MSSLPSSGSGNRCSRSSVSIGIESVCTPASGYLSAAISPASHTLNPFARRSALLFITTSLKPSIGHGGLPYLDSVSFLPDNLTSLSYEPSGVNTTRSVQYDQCQSQEDQFHGDLVLFNNSAFNHLTILYSYDACPSTIHFYSQIKVITYQVKAK